MVSLKDATLYVWLEDSTEIDRPALTIAATTVRGITGQSQSLSFELTAPDNDNTRRRTLRVLVDLDGDGRVGHGDYLSVESVLVPAGGTAVTVNVPVRRY